MSLDKIKDAEEKLKIAENELAKTLGFHLCDRHWPAGITLRGEDNRFYCRDCGASSPTFPMSFFIQ